MDLKYIIWNYQAKRLHFTCNKKNLVIPTHEFVASNLQRTGHHQRILKYITCKLPVQCINVQVHLLGTKLLERFPTKSTSKWSPSSMSV